MIKLMSFLVLLLAATLAPQTAANESKNQPNKGDKIQVALLLDTSGSMDGLIEQAKSQLWKMVNELARAKRDGISPDIEIALYEYGKDSYAAKDGYLKQLVPMTTDLDLVSEKLFQLRTNGGQEYCGWVIKDAVEKLEWSKDKDALKIIIIAGNEPFTQGSVDYKDACKQSITNGIVVNTIFCGACEEGVRTMWKDGADRADGKYMCINHNEAVVHIETPFDKKIIELNDALNKTYIAFGAKGLEKKERQSVQDANAGGYGKANMAERAASKASTAYKNDDWDAVDAFEKNKEDILKLKDEELPAEMKGMDKKQREEYLTKKAAEREAIQKEIQEANDSRMKYISEERKKQTGGAKNTLDEVMLDAVRKQAQDKNFKFDKIDN